MPQIPFTFESIHLVPIPHDDEINFPSGSIPPVSDGQIMMMSLQVFQNEVFPEDTVMTGEGDRMDF